jgi:hypothetical protein
MQGWESCNESHLHAPTEMQYDLTGDSLLIAIRSAPFDRYYSRCCLTPPHQPWADLSHSGSVDCRLSRRSWTPEIGGCPHPSGRDFEGVRRRKGSCGEIELDGANGCWTSVKAVPTQETDSVAHRDKYASRREEGEGGLGGRGEVDPQAQEASE